MSGSFPPSDIATIKVKNFINRKFFFVLSYSACVGVIVCIKQQCVFRVHREEEESVGQ